MFKPVCPFDPQAESGATRLTDLTSPEIEKKRKKEIWLQRKDMYKLLKQHTAKVLCHMKLIL